MEFNKNTLTKNPEKLNICDRYEGITVHVSNVWFVVRFLTSCMLCQ